MFDASKEACLARRYQASAERGFYRALKEFRMIEKRAIAAEPPIDMETLREELGSFLKRKEMDPDFGAMLAAMNQEMPFGPPRTSSMAPIPTSASPVDVPISIGKRR